MSKETSIARHVVVHGDVQGVFFRDSCRQEAEDHGVTGWVRNEPDGTVAAHFEGAAAAVEHMVEWARSGPSRAMVEHVEVRDVEASGEAGFRLQ